MNVQPHTLDSDRIWELIDAVLVINLEHRSERWDQFMQMARHHIPLEKIHRVDAIYGANLKGFGLAPWFRGRKRDKTWGARAGCTLSHRKALQIAADNKWEAVLVLEDDIVIDPAFSQIKRSIYGYLTQDREEWDVVYFGFTDPWGPFQKIADLGEGRSLQKVYGCNCAHAYLISKNARDWALKMLPQQEGIWQWLSTHRAVDRWYRRTLGRHFTICCVSPAAINQTAGYSDIIGKETQRHQETGHMTSVRESSENPLFFRFLYFLKISHSWLHEAYDRLRARSKKARGL